MDDKTPSEVEEKQIQDILIAYQQTHVVSSVCEWFINSFPIEEPVFYAQRRLNALFAIKTILHLTYSDKIEKLFLYYQNEAKINIYSILNVIELNFQSFSTLKRDDLEYLTDKNKRLEIKNIFYNKLYKKVNIDPKVIASPFYLAIRLVRLFSAEDPKNDFIYYLLMEIYSEWISRNDDFE